jgi:hypothetical protein
MDFLKLSTFIAGLYSQVWLNLVLDDGGGMATPNNYICNSAFSFLGQMFELVQKK